MTYGAVAEIVYSQPERRTRMLLADENANLRADMERAQAHETRPDERREALWHRRAEVRRADQLHAAAMAGVAW